MMRKPGNQLAVIDLSKRRHLAEDLLVLLFLRDQHQLQAELVHVGHHDLPLGELRNVVSRTFLIARPGIDLLTVTVDVHGDRVERIHAFAGKIVQRANDALALAIFARRDHHSSSP